MVSLCVNLYFTVDVISNEKLVLNISLVITKTCSVFIALNVTLPQKAGLKSVS